MYSVLLSLLQAIARMLLNLIHSRLRDHDCLAENRPKELGSAYPNPHDMQATYERK